MAKEYGFSNVVIEDFPTGQTWQPVVGELWVTAPTSEKLYDIHDIPESLASANATGDISGELIDVDQGTAKDSRARTSRESSTGGDELAARVSSENLSRGTERMGAAERKGTSLASVEASIDKTAAALTDAARAIYVVQTQRLNVQPVVDPPQTAEEKEASNLIVECASGTPSFAGCGGGGRGGAGGGGGRGAAASSTGGTRGAALPQHMNAELAILLGQHKSVLEIRDFLSGEFEPVALSDVMAVLRAREAQGTIKLMPRAPVGRGAR